MIHSFDSDIAAEYGILEAVLVYNIHYWIEKNKANGKNFYDGTYWTYNSTKAFSSLFPYASERQIKAALKHLRDKEILKTGNYNENTYDRTLWYALTEKGISIVQNGTMHGTKSYNAEDENEQSSKQNGTMESTEMSNPLDADVQPIPNNKPYSKPYIKPDINNSCPESSSEPQQEEKQKPFITLPLNTGEEYSVSMNDIEEYKSLYPAVDVQQAMRNMRGWLLANDKKRKTKQGIKRFITSWLSREQDRGPVKQSKPVNRSSNKFHNFQQRPYTEDDYERMERLLQERLLAEIGYKKGSTY